MSDAPQHAPPPAGGHPAPRFADRAARVAAAVYLTVLLAFAVAYHGLWFGDGGSDVALMAYGLIVVTYITSRTSRS
jgi:hypothetical protein